MKKVIIAIFIVALNGVITSCSADAYEESLINGTQATEGDDGQVTPPPPPPPPLDEDN
ncbi:MULTISPECIES: hypothetical protein [unclassified Leeuwenhoekiella]|uniref:hypothetical protein n=1 Tax=unclassified Leeuwenhoekiella TaxID=2615029 RepID=UPI0025BC06D9|nr:MULTISPECIES: hypothetical protein [unclassified Leeuwenhoekiella]|tara:strand:+ start:1079 stop:1252 length:174 start_codon:yes stop_codon:yes gene_type:complete